MVGRWKATELRLFLIINGFDDVRSDYEKWPISCVLEGHVVHASTKNHFIMKFDIFGFGKFGMFVDVHAPIASL